MQYQLNETKLDIFLNEKAREESVRSFLNDLHVSRKNIYILMQKEDILLDGIPVKNADRKMKADVLSILLEKSQPDWPASDKACMVLYEDDFVYVVHKQPGIIIHNHEDPLHCLNAEASRYQLQHHIDAPVRPIHRLDKETQGLVLYSKIPFFQPWLDDQLAEKKIHRTYLAIVKGKMKQGEKFSVHEPIGRDRHVSDKYRVSSSGKDALTYFEVLAVKNEYSLVKCTLSTGRTHQIRVHLAWKGYPIVNDRLYGYPSHDFRYMGLWAYRLDFFQPITNKWFKVMDVKNHDFAYFGKEIIL